jgi:hypothetical protein
MNRPVVHTVSRLARGSKAIYDFGRRYVIRTEKGTGRDETPPKRFIVDDEFMKWINSRQFQAKSNTE